VLRSKDRTLTQPAARTEGFTLEDVPSGTYTLSMDAPAGSFWPITTNAEWGGQPVSLNGRDLERIELGLAVPEPLQIAPQVIGVAYEDTDGDGAIDPGECGIPGWWDGAAQ